MASTVRWLDSKLSFYFTYIISIFHKKELMQSKASGVV